MIGSNADVRRNSRTTNALRWRRALGTYAVIPVFALAGLTILLVGCSKQKPAAPTATNQNAANQPTDAAGQKSSTTQQTVNPWGAETPEIAFQKLQNAFKQQ